MGIDIRWNENEVLVEIQRAKRKALRDIGKLITREAKSLCPVGIEIRSSSGPIWKEREPGSLRKSIYYKLVNKGTGVQVIAGSKKRLSTHGGRRYMGRDPFYARFVEFGTKKMMARPYLRPAVYRNRLAIMSLLDHRM